MILFFGTRQVVRDDDRPGAGMQHCPRCGQYAIFNPRKSRTFVHVFWLPIIPLGSWQPLLECTNCHARYVA